MTDSLRRVAAGIGTLVCAAGLLSAQDTKADANKQKARELMEKVDITVRAADPEVSVVALGELAAAWKPLDEKRAVTYLQQAFAAAAALPDPAERPARSKMQGEILKSAVAISLPEACQLLRSMPASESRTAAADAIITALLDRKEYDQAMEVLALTPADADYPFGGAQRLFEELPKDDSRRLIVFGNAAAAYRRRPADAFRMFLGKHWREVPRETASTALDSVMKTILDREDDSGNGESLETSKGTVKLAGRRSMELFDLLGAIRSLDPVRYKVLMEQNADLRAAAGMFPDGRQAVESSGTLRTVANKNGLNSSYSNNDFDAIPPMSMFAGADEKSMQEMMRAFVDDQKKAGEAWGAYQKDHNRGLALAEDVKLPSLHAELLIKFADAVKKDPPAANNLLSKAVALIGDIQDAGDRSAPSSSAAELYHELKNDKAAWELMQQALDGVVALYRSDTDAERPNKALREYWPSTLGIRYTMHSAVKLFGPRSEDLLGALPTPDLLLMAQVDLARSLLGVSVFDMEHGSAFFQVNH